MADSPASESELAVVFFLEEQAFALRLGAVSRVLRALAVTPLPGAPAIVRGVIDVQGELVPVVDLRRRFGMPEKDVTLGDQILVANSGRQAVALVVDGTGGVVEYRPEDFVPIAQVVPGAGGLAGLLKAESGLVLVQDLDALLALDEAAALAAAMSHA